MKTCSVILVAAGGAHRAGTDKLLAPLMGKPVLGWCLEVFLASPRVREIVVVCPETRWLALQNVWNFPIPSGMALLRVDGGRERQDSVMAGLKVLSTGSPLVAVHDGARPLLRGEQLERCAAAAEKWGAAASAHPVVDTLKRADEHQTTLPEEKIDREGLWAMETPQVFNAELLKKAYANVQQTGALVTDEVSAVERMGRPVYLVRNQWPNPKITYAEDFAIAEALMYHHF